MERNLFFFVFLLFVVLTARDFLVKWNQSMEQASAGAGGAGVHAADNVVGGGGGVGAGGGNVQKEIPSLSFGAGGVAHHAGGPTVKVLYCFSCGYRQAFEEYQRMINERFPHINVVGANYESSFLKSKLVQVISIGKMVVIGLLLANINPFSYYGINTPNAWRWMTEHKLYACMMTFFLSNTIESQLLASGAFEIFFNDVPIWSKLATGRIPNAQELFTMIDNQNKFYGNDLYGESMHTIPGHPAL
ncbi:hypothetical protein TYRP_000570 [Tyrophagus putrescentiae]|nr:hypothetical protein TYRP_000570 [Tyrophagus putrescentiae]